jgi:hypothetical protein
MEKRSTVKSVQSNGTFDFNDKTFYKYEIEMSNGDTGEYNSLSANQTHFVEGADVDYIYDVSKPQYPKIKPVYNFKASPSRDGNFKNMQKAAQGDNIQKMIVKQSCLKAAVECLSDRATVTHILETANIFVDWVINDEMPSGKPKRKSKKETTDLPF